MLHVSFFVADAPKHRVSYPGCLLIARVPSNRARPAD